MTVAGRASDELFKSDPARGIDVIGRFDDPAPLLADASVVVVPLRHGSGTRLKILEAFAYGLPVVSTAIGAEGLDVVDGETILIADDPNEFADNVVYLFENRERASSLAKAGQELFLSRYSPQVFSATVMNIAREVTRTGMNGETLCDNTCDYQS
jgi:glycosyltransferase involved in cell wall biosynthesis